MLAKQKPTTIIRRRPAQSKKDFLYATNRGRCTYCNNKIKKSEACLVTKNFTVAFEPPNNKVLACKKCAAKKGGMNHFEFILFLRKEKNKKRKELTKRKKIREEIFKKYKYNCIYCEFEFGYTPPERKAILTLEHKKPLSRLGGNNKKNLACACEIHNREKGNRTADEYFAYLEKHGRKYSSKKQETPEVILETSTNLS